MGKMPMPFDNPSTYPGHSGIDFGEPMYTPIRSIADGTITYRDQWGTWGTYNGRYQRGAGLTVTVTRPDGLKIMSCHMPDFELTPRLGTRVRVGDVIGRVGNTGRSTGPHLHTEFWLNGQPQWEWDWMTPTDWIGKPKPAAPPVVKPLPIPKPTPTKEIEMIRFIYLRGNDNNAIFQVDLETGRSRHLGPTEWKSIQGSYVKQGLKDPLVQSNTTRAQLLKAFPPEA